MGAFYELSQAEREIMEVIWDRGEAVTAGELLTVFAQRAWKAQTMSTFLSRLADKGMLGTAGAVYPLSARPQPGGVPPAAGKACGG